MTSILEQPEHAAPFEYYVPDFDEAEAYNLPFDEEAPAWAPVIRDEDRVGVIRSALARHDWALAVLALSKIRDPDLRGVMTSYLQQPAAPDLHPRVQSDLWRIALRLGKEAQGARRMKCLQYDALDVANMFRIGVCLILLSQEGATDLQFQYARARFRPDPARDTRSLPRGAVQGVSLRIGDGRMHLYEANVPFHGGSGGLVKQADGSVSFEFETHPSNEAPCLRSTGLWSVYGSARGGGDPGAAEMLRCLERGRAMSRATGTYASWARVLHFERELNEEGSLI